MAFGLELLHPLVQALSAGHSEAKAAAFLLWMLFSAMLFVFFRERGLRLPNAKKFLFFSAAALWLFGIVFTVLCLNSFGASLTDSVSTLSASGNWEWEKSELVHTHFLKPLLYSIFPLRGDFDFGRPFFEVLSPQLLSPLFSIPFVFLLLLFFFSFLSLLLLQENPFKAAAFSVASFVCFVSFFDGGLFSVSGMTGASFLFLLLLIEFLPSLLPKNLLPFAPFVFFAVFSVFITSLLGLWTTHLFSLLSLFLLASIYFFDFSPNSKAVLALSAILFISLSFAQFHFGPSASYFYAYGLPPSWAASETQELFSQRFGNCSVEKEGWMAFISFDSPVNQRDLESFIRLKKSELGFSGYAYADPARSSPSIAVVSPSSPLPESFLGLKAVKKQGNNYLVEGAADRNSAFNAALSVLAERERNPVVVGKW